MRYLSLPLWIGLAAPAGALGAELTRSGGVLGSTLTYDLAGDPGEIFGLALSTNTGPTPLAIFDPADPRLLEVGVDLIGQWEVGLLDGAGQAQLAIPLPAQVALQGLALHAQMVTVPGTTTVVDEISDRNSFVLLLPQGSARTAFDNVAQISAHQATALPDGSALVSGGLVAGLTATASNAYVRFDPQAGDFTTLGGTMVVGRTQHTATLLADGRVLTLGGSDENNVIHASGEILDPVSGQVTSIPSMSVPRVGHSATLLPDGRVFVAGGTASFDFSDPLGALGAVHGSTEIFDPGTGNWSGGPNLPKPRALHRATLTGAGQVLITGGIELTTILFVSVPDFSSDARRYDPATNSILAAGSFSTVRASHAQLTLSNGDVLVAGGVNGDLIAQTFSTLASCRLYDTSTNSWSNVATLGTPRVFADLIEDGSTVVALGGLSSFDLVAGTGTPATGIETAGAALGAWTPAGSLVLPRFLSVSTPVDGGQWILTTGVGDNGTGGTVPELSAEVYAP